MLQIIKDAVVGTKVEITAPGSTQLFEKTGRWLGLGVGGTSADHN